MSPENHDKIALAALLYTVFAGIVLAFGVASYRHADSFSRHMGQQQASVTAIRENSYHSKGDGWQDTLSASFSAGGQVFTARGERHHGAAHLGDVVQVIYDIRNPAHTAFIGRPEDLWQGWESARFFTGFLGALAAVLWLVYAFTAGRKPSVAASR